MHLCVLLNLPRGHYDCVSGTISHTDCLQDPLHALCHFTGCDYTRGSELLGVGRLVAVGDYTFYFFCCNKATCRQMPYSKVTETQQICQGQISISVAILR